MTKRDFFIVLVKILSLFYLIALVSTMLPNMSLVFSYEFDVISFIVFTVASAISIGIFLLLLFKPKSIVQSLKLDKGFDDDRIEFGNLAAADIVKIGCFIIGGLLLVDNIADVIYQTVLAFKNNMQNVEYNYFDVADTYFDKYLWITSAIRAAIGFLLLTNYDFVAKLLKAKDKEETKE